MASKSKAKPKAKAKAKPIAESKVSKLIIELFSVLLGVFILTVITMFSDSLREFLGRMSIIYMILLFGILGLVLFILTWKSDIKKPLRTYLLLAGGAPPAAFVSVILHNLVSGALTVLMNSPEVVDEAFFFILGVIVCPIAYVVGVVGTLVYLLKKR